LSSWLRRCFQQLKARCGSLRQSFRSDATALNCCRIIARRISHDALFAAQRFSCHTSPHTDCRSPVAACNAITKQADLCSEGFRLTCLDLAASSIYRESGHHIHSVAQCPLINVRDGLISSLRMEVARPKRRTNCRPCRLQQQCNSVQLRAALVAGAAPNRRRQRKHLHSPSGYADRSCLGGPNSVRAPARCTGESCQCSAAALERALTNEFKCVRIMSSTSAFVSSVQSKFEDTLLAERSSSREPSSTTSFIAADLCAAIKPASRTIIELINARNARLSQDTRVSDGSSRRLSSELLAADGES